MADRKMAEAGKGLGASAATALFGPTGPPPSGSVEESLARRRPFQLREPERLASGVVFSSPHSGRAYFSSFVADSRLDLRRLRASEDAYVDRLFESAARFGAPVLSAVAPRAFVDLNRCPTDLDPCLVDGADQKPSNARVAAGLGVVPRIVAEGVPIYAGTLSLAEAMSRIRSWHEPYHEQLAGLLLRARREFGKAILIDCHSMPSGAVGRRRPAPAQIVLGDRFGVSSECRFVDEVEAAFDDAGFRVERNAPFAGGYITERYGRPAGGVSALQIEIDRALYLDQNSVAPSRDFDAFVERLQPVIRRICGLIPPGFGDLGATSLAAE